jgi:adenosine/AMP kinase
MPKNQSSQKKTSKVSAGHTLLMIVTFFITVTYLNQIKSICGVKVDHCAG